MSVTKTLIVNYSAFYILHSVLYFSSRAEELYLKSNEKDTM